MAERVVKIAGSSVQSTGTMDVESHTSIKEGEAAKRSSADVERVPGSMVQRSVEGWVVVATGIHEEAREDDLQDFFGDYGRIHNLHLNLNRQTGYVKGYALVEYASFEEASRAAEKATGKKFLGQPIAVDFAFVKDEGRTRRRSGRRERDDELDERRDREGKEPAAVKLSREQSPDRGF
ncbi:RNA-binding protein [Coemansia sp. RSA 2399]|nr:RNA-binding protein [Coemansia sp. RSA 2399]KAJ1908473.1 RNA-binding protein [Coemansia sp. IMI 209127]